MDGPEVDARPLPLRDLFGGGVLPSGAPLPPAIVEAAPAVDDSAHGFKIAKSASGMWSLGNGRFFLDAKKL